MSKQLEIGFMMQEMLETPLTALSDIQNNLPIITISLSDIQNNIQAITTSFFMNSKIFMKNNISSDEDVVKVSSDEKGEYIEYDVKKMKVGKFYSVKYQDEIHLLKRTKDDQIESYDVI
jgi:hypothetical protein